uniref:Uncharacterized protein n=1 Tax=Anguilla anguilla TaxID=7936 RepID=A0A0E9VWK4_ANGAN
MGKVLFEVQWRSVRPDIMITVLLTKTFTGKQASSVRRPIKSKSNQLDITKLSPNPSIQVTLFYNSQDLTYSAT